MKEAYSGEQNTDQLYEFWKSLILSLNYNEMIVK